MDGDITKEGINTAAHAVLDPSCPPFQGIGTFHVSTDCCLPRSIDMMHDLKVLGGMTPCQNPACVGKFSAKVDKKNEKLEMWADLDAKSAMVLVLLLTGRVMMGADLASLRIMANLLSSTPAILMLDCAAKRLVQCT
eukprot:8483651-Ditylum_brightwellii.AAC.1